MKPAMKLSALLELLGRPEAYPYPVTSVEVRQTHISAVFLAGPWVYKIKKPVSLGFLDFSTLEKRRHYCSEEVRLNRRLAPDVYAGVVPIARCGAGLRFERDGEVIEYAVKMRRLPEEATLEQRLRRGEISGETIEMLGRRLAEFHARAETNANTAAFGRLEVVAGNARDNFAQAAALVGITLSQPVLERLRAGTEVWLGRLGPLVEARAKRGVPRDTHGDLHLDHIYFFPDRPSPEQLVIIDCIEFSERFRYADPVADLAFLAMDLKFHGRPDLAERLAEVYFQATGDDEGRPLLPFYTAYRAAVRGKVEGLELREPEVPDPERAAARLRGRAHWLLALGELEPPGQRPCLLLVAGLPGTGKSTLAARLAEQAGFTILRSDVIRKQWAAAEGITDLYTPQTSERTYAECLRQAEVLLFEGRRVLIDATFREEKKRRLFVDLANRLGVPLGLFICRARPETVRARLEARQGDASEADWSVHARLRQEWEDPEPAGFLRLGVIETDGGIEGSLSLALDKLRAMGL